MDRIQRKVSNLICSLNLTLVIFCVCFMYMLNSGIMEINLHVFPGDTLGDLHVKSSIVNFPQLFRECAENRVLF